MLGKNSWNQLNRIDQIYREHFEAIKEIFICATVDAPDFKKDSFYKFCEKAGIPDRRLNRGIIDTYFKAVNFEIDD